MIGWARYCSKDQPVEGDEVGADGSLQHVVPYLGSDCLGRFARLFNAGGWVQFLRVYVYESPDAQ